MVSTREVLEWRGRHVVDREGEKLGKLEDVYFDNETSAPEWGAVKTGLFGLNLSFVPLEGSYLQGDNVVVSFEKDQIKDAPNLSPHHEMSLEEERKLYDYYGHTYEEPQAQGRSPVGSTQASDRSRSDDDSRDRNDAPDYEKTSFRQEHTRESQRGRMRKYSQDKEEHTEETR